MHAFINRAHRFEHTAIFVRGSKKLREKLSASPMYVIISETFQHIKESMYEFSDHIFGRACAKSQICNSKIEGGVPKTRR